MKKLMKRMLALTLSAVLTLGMVSTASAYKFPQSYWALQDQWVSAVESKSVDGTITAAEKIWDLLIRGGLNETVCQNLEPKAGKASWCCEMKGDIDGAAMWLDRQEQMARWLTDHGIDRKDTLMNIPARRAYLDAARSMTIYAQTDEAGQDYTRLGAAAQGTLYGSVAEGSRTGESAVLAYINFNDGYSVSYWLDYFKAHMPKFADAARNGGVIELAWNFQPESTYGSQLVTQADAYINEGVRALAGLNATVLLRIGAEMNNWEYSDPDAYKQAYRKVAAAAAPYDNLKLVFSPNDIANRNRKFTDYYPGDDVVDWVGVNTYNRTNYRGKANSYSYDNVGDAYADAFYGTGIYDSDPLVILKPYMDFAQKHNKPVMISETGFPFYDAQSGDQTPYAVDQMTRFYSYVNMIYPQVRAVFYFDFQISGGRYNYRLADSAQLSAAYENAITQNGGYIQGGETSAKVWKPLNGRTASDKLRLATYASFPGNQPTAVTYHVDGKWAKTTDQIPFTLDLDLNKLSAGTHTVKAYAVSGKFSYTTTAAFTVKAVDAPHSWAKAIVDQARAAGLVTARTDSGYRENVTRLQFAELAANMIETVTGKPIDCSGFSFSDTSDPMVLKAAAAGVTKGYDNGNGTFSFKPDNQISRQEICTMLSNTIDYLDSALGTVTLTDPSTTVSPAFKDAADIPGWAVPFVAKMTNNGIMAGSDGRVDFLGRATVEQSIILIQKLYQKF